MSKDTSCLLVNGHEDGTGHTTRIKAAAVSCLTLSMFFFSLKIRAICSMRWHPRLIRWPYIGLFFFPDSFRENKHCNKHAICSLFLCLLLPTKIFFPFSLSLPLMIPFLSLCFQCKEHATRLESLQLLCFSSANEWHKSSTRGVNCYSNIERKSLWNTRHVFLHKSDKDTLVSFVCLLKLDILQNFSSFPHFDSLIDCLFRVQRERVLVSWCLFLYRIIWLVPH